MITYSDHITYAISSVPSLKVRYRILVSGTSRYPVEVGVEEGLKHDSAIYCDELISFPKSILTDYVGALPDEKMELVNTALRIALAID